MVGKNQGEFKTDYDLISRVRSQLDAIKMMNLRNKK